MEAVCSETRVSTYNIRTPQSEQTPLQKPENQYHLVTCLYLFAVITQSEFHILDINISRFFNFCTFYLPNI
jgi:hypothetical protein